MKKIIKKIINILIVFLVSIITIVTIIFCFYPAIFVDFYVGSDRHSIWAIISPGSFSWKILNTSSEPDDLRWSPDEKYLAFFDDVYEPHDREYLLKVINPRTMRAKTIFIGPWITSNYEWIDNNTIRVFIGGASGARFYRNLDIHRKEPYVHADDRATDDDSEWGIEVYKSDGSTIQVNGNGSTVRVYDK